MSISNGGGTMATAAPEFSAWLGGTFAAHGDFTALVVLVRIAPPRLVPLASTFMTFVGDEVSWSEIRALFAGARQAWDGACFFPVLDAGGPLDNGAARARLRRLEERVAADRLVLNEGQFFDTLGRRLEVEEVPDADARSLS